MFAEENADDYLPGCCPGCQLPWTSCVCTSPWSELVTPMEFFARTDPPAFWRKKDQEEFRAQLVAHQSPEIGVTGWAVYKPGMKRAERIDL